MGTQNGNTKDNLKSFIKNNYSNLSYPYIVRLLRLASQENKSFDELFDDLNIHPYLSLAFPASDIQNIKEYESNKYDITANFMGLYGTGSPLPTFYTEELLEERDNDRSALEDFYKIFNSRQYEFYFSAWLKYKLSLRAVEAKDKNALDIYYSLIGKNYSSDFKKLKHISRYELLRYSHLFVHKNRSAEGLRLFLSGLLGVDIDIRQGVESVELIPQNQLNALGVINTTLDEDLHLGDTIWTLNSRFIIILKNLNQDDFHRLLPDSHNYKVLAEAVSVYLNEHLKWDVEYTLSEGHKETSLGSDRWSNLGWNTWTA